MHKESSLMYNSFFHVLYIWICKCVLELSLRLNEFARSMVYGMMSHFGTLYLTRVSRVHMNQTLS